MGFINLEIGDKAWGPVRSDQVRTASKIINEAREREKEGRMEERRKPKLGAPPGFLSIPTKFLLESIKSY